MSTVSGLPVAFRCEACGEAVPEGLNRCPACGQQPRQRSDQIVLLLVIASLIAMFFMDQYIVNRHRQTELALAHSWLSRGDRAMLAGYSSIAAEDYRTALTYDRENDEYRLRLAEALLAANRFEEARSHLLSLWEEGPADGEVNLALARLYARQGNAREAVRYYRNAINGVWRDASRDHRIAARFELVQYLLQQHDTRQAEAELIALQADAPQDEDQQLKLAQLLLQIGDAARAQGVYETLLKVDGNNAQAWLGDGKASFAMGDYAAAERELATAVALDKASTGAARQLALTREILRIAPDLRGLSLADRARRVAEAFRVASNRLTGCAAGRGYQFNPPASSTGTGDTVKGAGQRHDIPVTTSASSAPVDLQTLYASGLQLRNSATEQALRKNPDSLEPVMDFVFDVERATQLILADRRAQAVQ